MVFSAKSRNSAGTSSFGSIISAPSDMLGGLPHFRNGVCAQFGSSEPNIYRPPWYIRRAVGAVSSITVGMNRGVRRDLPRVGKPDQASCARRYVEGGFPASRAAYRALAA